MKRIIAAALAAVTFSGVSASAQPQNEIWLWDNKISREEFLADFAKPGRPEFYISDESGHESNVDTVEFEGRKSFFLHGKTQYLYGRVPENMSGDTAVKVTFYDRFIDYVRYTYTQTNGSGRNVLICKGGTNSWRTETILIDNSKFNDVMKYGTDFYINSYESAIEMGNDYVADVEFINLDTDADAADESGNKANVLQQGTLVVMSGMGFFDENTDLAAPAGADAVNRIFEQITGKSCQLSGDVTVGGVLDAYASALGFAGGSRGAWLESGLLKNLNKHPQKWFGNSVYKTQNYGLYDCAVNDYSRPLYWDDLVGIAYNLLLVKNGGESYLAKLCENEEFFDRMTATNERTLVYSYYFEKGFRVKESERVDAVTGQTIHEYYLPGANMNIPYINELATVDNENYVFCAGIDKQLNKGYPVVYNTTTKKTVTVDFEQMDKFAMVLSEGNILYYTVGSQLREYNINTGTKRTLWQEENGCSLQEIPTITRDGRYVCLFWGAENKSNPDHIGIYDTKTGEMRTWLDADWVRKNLYGAPPVFVGHVIINPVDETLVQFLHGGPDGVEDRMWFLDTDTGRTWEAPATTRRYDGGLGEQPVHWVWSYNGERLYYIRMSSSLTAPQGIVYYDINDTQKGVQVADNSYPYTHAVPDRDDKLIVADTLKTASDGVYKSEIVLYDYQSDTARLMAFNSSWSGHPCHSHPIFSLDGSRIMYNSATEQTALCRVGEIEIAETVADMRENGNKKHYEKAEVVFDEKRIETGIRVRNDVENGTARPASVDGEACVYIDNKTTLFADVDGEHIKPSDRRVQLAITYFDGGYEPFILSYNTGNSTEISGTKNAKAVKIPKRNTNRWVRRVITLEDASFRSSYSGSYDFTLTTKSSTEQVLIKAIEAVALK